MQGDGVRLVFDENPRMLRGEVLQQRQDLTQVIGLDGRSGDRAIRPATLKPVQPGDGGDDGVQKTVDLLDGPAVTIATAPPNASRNATNSEGSRSGTTESGVGAISTIVPSKSRNNAQSGQGQVHRVRGLWRVRSCLNRSDPPSVPPLPRHARTRSGHPRLAARRYEPGASESADPRGCPERPLLSGLEWAGPSQPPDVTPDLFRGPTGEGIFRSGTSTDPPSPGPSGGRGEGKEEVASEFPLSGERALLGRRPAAILPGRKMERRLTIWTPEQAG